jgi:hypothetical protein
MKFSSIKLILQETQAQNRKKIGKAMKFIGHVNTFLRVVSALDGVLSNLNNNNN